MVISHMLLILSALKIRHQTFGSLVFYLLMSQVL